MKIMRCSITSLNRKCSFLLRRGSWEDQSHDGLTPGCCACVQQSVPICTALMRHTTVYTHTLHLPSLGSFWKLFGDSSCHLNMSRSFYCIRTGTGTDFMDCMPVIQAWELHAILVKFPIEEQKPSLRGFFLLLKGYGKSQREPSTEL